MNRRKWTSYSEPVYFWYFTYHLSDCASLMWAFNTICSLRVNFPRVSSASFDLFKPNARTVLKNVGVMSSSEFLYFAFSGCEAIYAAGTQGTGKWIGIVLAIHGHMSSVILSSLALLLPCSCLSYIPSINSSSRAEPVTSWLLSMTWAIKQVRFQNLIPPHWTDVVWRALFSYVINACQRACTIGKSFKMNWWMPVK